MVMPHGVLFRGGEERRSARGSSRTAFSKRSSGFRRTCSTARASPPASSCCVRKEPNLRSAGKVLFINADTEFYAGRAQNFLIPEHVGKIVAAYHAFAEIPGYARLSPTRKLAPTTSTSTSAATQTTHRPLSPRTCEHTSSAASRSGRSPKSPRLRRPWVHPQHVFMDATTTTTSSPSPAASKADLRSRVVADPGIRPAKTSS